MKQKRAEQLYRSALYSCKTPVLDPILRSTRDKLQQKVVRRGF